MESIRICQNIFKADFVLIIITKIIEEIALYD